MNTIKSMSIIAVLLLVATLLAGIVSAQDWLEEFEEQFPEGYMEQDWEGWKGTMPWSEDYWEVPWKVFNVSETPAQANLELKNIIIQFPKTILPMISISNITVDADIPENVGKNATTRTSTEAIDNVSYSVINVSKPIGGIKMYIGMDAVNEDIIMKRVVTEPGIANLTFDPAFVLFDFPLYYGKTWTDTTNVTGMQVNETGAVIPIDSNLTVYGAVTDAVNLTVPYGSIPCLVIEINCSYDVMGQPTSYVEKYWIRRIDDDGIVFPKSQRYFNGVLIVDFELIDLISPTVFTTANKDNVI
jgi:hypothetical protein